MAMQVGTQLYLNHPVRYEGVKRQFFKTIERSQDPQWVAMAVSALAKGGMTPNSLQYLSDRIRQRFPQGSQDVILQTTLQDVAESTIPSPMPPLKDLLNWTIAPGKLQLYVICQPDREMLCLAVLKGRKGQFLRSSAAPGLPTSLTTHLAKLQTDATNLWGGKLGRALFRIHGSGEAPNFFFKSEPDAPSCNWNPTLGCLSA